MLMIDQKAALEALPSLLPEDAEARRNLLGHIEAIRTAAGELEGEAKRRLDEIEAILVGTTPTKPKRRASPKVAKAKVVEKVS
jgi:hypothetical protein